MYDYSDGYDEYVLDYGYDLKVENSEKALTAVKKYICSCDESWEEDDDFSEILSSRGEDAKTVALYTKADTAPWLHNVEDFDFREFIEGLLPFCAVGSYITYVDSGDQACVCRRERVDDKKNPVIERIGLLENVFDLEDRIKELEAELAKTSVTATA